MKIFDWVKLSGKHAFTLLIFTSLVIFTPESFLSYLGLKNFKDGLVVWFGVFWVLSISILFSELCAPLWKYLVESLKYKIQLARFQKRLKSLPLNEKKILATYLDEQTRTKVSHFDDGPFLTLVHDEILYMPVKSGKDGIVNYCIRPWAWDFINSNPESVKNA